MISSQHQSRLLDKAFEKSCTKESDCNIMPIDGHKSSRVKTLAARSGISFKSKLRGGNNTAMILFMCLICFLIIASSRCDKAAGTNAIKDMIATSEDIKSSSLPKSIIGRRAAFVKRQGATSSSNSNSINSAMSKLDPLGMLREIYLDQNSKSITMLAPGFVGDQVQKFHPNGRYGRRSIEFLTNEPHTELAKLVHNDYDNKEQHSLKNEFSGNNHDLNPSLNNDVVNKLVSEIVTCRRKNPQQSSVSSDAFYYNGAQMADYDIEMNKLLRCNYLGVSDLYRCESSHTAANS